MSDVLFRILTLYPSLQPHAHPENPCICSFCCIRVVQAPNIFKIKKVFLEKMQI